MNNILFKIRHYQITRLPRLRSHYFRFRHLLERPCSEIVIQNMIRSEEEEAVLKMQSRYGPLSIDDLVTLEHKQILSNWSKTLPADPRFYRHLEDKMNIWRRFSNKNLQTFFESEEGVHWYKNRKRLTRKALFELDCPYKTSKRSALAREGRVRNLLRRHPLLRWEDLRALGFKNTQTILQRFPQRDFYRERFLKDLRDQIESE